MLVATYNIQWGKGRDDRVDLDRVARAIGPADLIGLQEVERNWRAMPHADQVTRLCELFKDRYVHFAPTVDVDASTKTADGQVNNARRQYGLAVVSRWPILTTRSFPLPKYPIHGALNDSSNLLETVIGHPSSPFRFYVTHLNYLSQRQRILQSQEIIRIMADAPRQGGPIVGPGVPEIRFQADWMMLKSDELPPMPETAILLGDFNMRPNSPEYEILAGPIDPRFGRMAEYGRFVDALTASGMKESEGTTYPAKGADQGKRIDHIFLTADLAGSVRRAWIDELADASDHQPVFADIDLGDQ